MAVNDALVFATLSACFGPVDEGTWAETTAPAAWSEFLTAARRLLQEVRPLSADSSPIEHAHVATPFSEYLTEAEVKALYAPLSFEEKRQFAARHFTGGLPASAVPVESLYVAWTERECALPFAERSGLYRSDAALYMSDLLASLGLEAPSALSAYPDHLCVECAVTAHLIDAGMVDEACQFWQERSAWLTDYRARLRRIGDEAGFYLALVDLMLGVRAAQQSCADSLATSGHSA